MLPLLHATMRIKWMWNSIVYPLGISITYQRPATPMIPNTIALNFLFGSLLIWLGGGG